MTLSQFATGLSKAAVLVILLTACGGEPDLAACEQAMRDQFDAAMAEGEEGTRPAACDGVPDKDLERIAGEIIGDAFTSDAECLAASDGTGRYTAEEMAACE